MRLTDDNVKNIVTALRGNNVLSRLSMIQNEISDTGAQYIAELIKEKKTLRQVLLEENKITAILPFKEAIGKNSSFKRLNLTNNPLLRKPEMELMEDIIKATMDYWLNQMLACNVRPSKPVIEQVENLTRTVLNQKYNSHGKIDIPRGMDITWVYKIDIGNQTPFHVRYKAI
jgi:Leucine-rich repeat (LRR) protein